MIDEEVPARTEVRMRDIQKKGCEGTVAFEAVVFHIMIWRRKDIYFVCVKADDYN